MRMKYKQFEIWLADLNPRIGTEPDKRRPVLVVQSDLLNRVHPSTIICPITTQVKDGVSILRVDLTKGEGGVNRESSIMIDQIRAIDNKRFLNKIGKLPLNLRDRVKQNIRIVLDMD